MIHRESQILWGLWPNSPDEPRRDWPGRSAIFTSFPYLFGLIVSSAACVEPIHESELQDPTQTSTLTPAQGGPSLVDSLWRAPLNAHEPWISADTTAHLQLSPIEEGGALGAWLSHVAGSLTVGDTPIPPDTWLEMSVTLLPDSARILLEGAGQGHTLQYDADLSDSLQGMAGYFTVDAEYEIFVEFERVSAF